MPRIYTSESNPLDFCRICFPSLVDALEDYGDLGDGPDGRGNCFGYACPHPPYGDTDGEYACEDCGKLLTDRDD